MFLRLDERFKFQEETMKEYKLEIRLTDFEGNFDAVFTKNDVDSREAALSLLEAALKLLPEYETHFDFKSVE